MKLLDTNCDRSHLDLQWLEPNLMAVQILECEIKLWFKYIFFVYIDFIFTIFDFCVFSTLMLVGTFFFFKNFYVSRVLC